MTQADLSRIERNIRSVIQRQPEAGFVPLHEPCFIGRERDYVLECIDTGWVSSVGKFVDRFEKELAHATGVKRAVALVNGTAALHLALRLVGVAPDDEVIMPTLTFVATPNAATYCGAVPHFVDSERPTLGMDPDKLDAYLGDILDCSKGQPINTRTGRRVGAVVPMHTFGHPVRIARLVEVCDKYNIPLVEDAAESLGSTIETADGWRPAGSFGLLSAMSFNGNKILTTGGGGAIITNDTKIAHRAKHLSTTAKVPHAWLFSHDEIGYNYRMPNINAALGCGQLEQLPGFVEKKRRIASKYADAFAAAEMLEFCIEPEGTKSNYWLCAAMVVEKSGIARDDVLAHLNSVGLMSRPMWTPMHKLDIYADCPKMDDLTGAETIARNLINLPSSPVLG